MQMTLSQNISRLRKENSMTQEQLAEALGISFAAVSKWERGVTTPELGYIIEMADLFGFTELTNMRNGQKLTTWSDFS